MCGISGIIQKETRRLGPEVIEAMNSALRHRGPDDEGYLLVNSEKGVVSALGGGDTPRRVWESTLPFAPKEKIARWSDDNQFDVMLANRRLAIIDLSPTGHQPMCSSDRRFWITYNGEIHNFEELRHELAGDGYRFMSASDTEVILAAYQKWGRQCLHKFNGMWAFAIWDRKSGTLFASRDRFGIKPFYYYWDGKTFLFASEIKALLSSRLVKTEPYDSAIYNYLAFGETDYGDETFFENIKQLRGGFYLEFAPTSGKLEIARWYDIPAQRAERLTDEEYALQLKALFEDSVRLRLISDVPVGTCLSGGLDSSAIVCVVDTLMRTQGLKLPGGDLQKTFSARYDVKPHDEGEYIEAVIKKTDVEPHFVYPQGEGLIADIPKLISAHDEPFGNTSAYAQWLVFKKAREVGVTVTLDGQGGDETMAGYHHYFGPYFADLLRSFRVLKFFLEFTAYRFHHKYSLRQAIRWIAPNFMPAYLRRMVRPLRMPPWVNREGMRLLIQSNYAPRLIGGALQRQLYLDTMGLLHALLRFEDRNSMAHSIESRLPFLDHRLVEFSFTVPDEAKIQNGTTKILLRNAMKDVLPGMVRVRQSKIGFSTPEDIWFRTVLVQWANELFHSPSFLSRPYFRHREIRRSYERHLRGEVNISYDIWRWINIELWLREFFS